MRHEQPVEMPSAHPQAFRQLRDAVTPQGPFLNQAQGPADRGRGTVPGGCSGRRLGPTAKTGPEARRHGFFGGPEKADVGAPGGRRRADRPAIDPCRDNTDEELPVESRVAGEARPVTDSRVQLHAGVAYRFRLHRLAIFGRQCRWRRRRGERRLLRQAEIPGGADGVGLAPVGVCSLDDVRDRREDVGRAEGVQALGSGQD
jgi:hypothetical protein